MVNKINLHLWPLSVFSPVTPSDHSQSSAPPATVSPSVGALSPDSPALVSTASHDLVLGADVLGSPLHVSVIIILIFKKTKF